MTINVAVVGLGFGADFLPIYQSHPLVDRIVLCDNDPGRLAAVGDTYGIPDRHTDLDAVLADDGVDAVHILSPVKLHRDHVLATLGAGKHCACAVPMGRTLDDLDAVIAAQQASGRTYMMMETAVYGREFFYAEDMVRSGRLGAVTFLRGVHIQDLDGFPEYWWGYPPMLYATHALSPLLALSGRTVRAVHARGSAPLPAHLIHEYDNPFGLETGLFALAGDEPLTAEVTVSFNRIARSYQEGFSIYGDQCAFEWPQFEDERPAVFELGPAPRHRRGGTTSQHRAELPDRLDTLPAGIRRFTRATDYLTPTGRVVRIASHHSGSHPHLVHEFLASIAEGRRPRVDAVTAARWCAPGICAHRSACEDGAAVEVPVYG